MVSPEDDYSNLFSDYSLIEQIPVPGGELPSLEPGFHWSADAFPGSTNLSSSGFVDSFAKSDGTAEHCSRKRANSGSCSTTDSKACREKRRRDKLNERFQELNEILDPGRPAKTDKTIILGDAIRMVTHLRDEATKLKESTQELQAKINELKAEKNELRDEKQKLKADKERLEQLLKSFSGPPAPAFLPPAAHSAIPFPFPAPNTVAGSKIVPFMGYPGVPLWHFASPTAVDTSQDTAHQSPVA